MISPGSPATSLWAFADLHHYNVLFDTRCGWTAIDPQGRWRGPIARQMVLKLVDGQIVFTPKPEDGCYEFSGRTVLDRLLNGPIGPEMTLPQVWRAPGDSRLAVPISGRIQLPA